MTASQIHDETAGAPFQAFAPIHKMALGVAVGLVAGGLLLIVTLGQLAIVPGEGGYLALLGQYFYGYTVSPTGAIVGLLWGFATGFVAGWFLAFVCNLTVAVTIFALRAKAELAQTRDFLDHI